MKEVTFEEVSEFVDVPPIDILFTRLNSATETSRLSVDKVPVPSALPNSSQGLLSLENARVLLIKTPGDLASPKSDTLSLKLTGSLT